MAKFWYALVNKNSNLTVKLAANNSVVFSKILGNVEHFTDEAEALDNLVKKGVLTKVSDAERKVMAKGAAKQAPKQIIQQKPEPKDEKPVIKPAPMPKPEIKAEQKPEPKPEEPKPESAEQAKSRRKTEQE